MLHVCFRKRRPATETARAKERKRGSRNERSQYRGRMRLGPESNPILRTCTMFMIQRWHFPLRIRVVLVLYCVNLAKAGAQLPQPWARLLVHLCTWLTHTHVHARHWNGRRGSLPYPCICLSCSLAVLQLQCYLSSCFGCYGWLPSARRLFRRAPPSRFFAVPPSLSSGPRPTFTRLHGCPLPLVFHPSVQQFRRARRMRDKNATQIHQAGSIM